jgi:hemerythrin-like domain-containing protein
MAKFGTPQRANAPAASATNIASLTSPTAKTNVLEDIQASHQFILAKFEEFKAAVGNARIVPFANLKAELRQHMEAEQSVFYPTVADISSDASDLVDTAISEQSDIEDALATIESVGAENASGGDISALETPLKAHIRSERAVIFPVVRKGLTKAQLRNLAALFSTAKAASQLS